MTPGDASKKKNEDRICELYQSNYDEYAARNGTAFYVVDVVRISKIKRLFENMITLSWTEELFRVTLIHNTKPTSFSIEDKKGKAVEGKFYVWEMKMTATFKQ